MANVKFSDFDVKTSTADVAFIVGYDGTDNVRITSANFLGDYLPLAGGTMTGNTLHGDNVKSVYGTGGDLEIYHSGTASIIKDAGVGNLQLNAGSFVLNNSADTKNMIIAVDGGATSLYYNGSLKLATTNTGISVTGDGIFSGNVGIGTASPSAPLDIRRSDTSGVVAEFHNNVGYGININVESDGGVNTIASASNQSLAFVTNGGTNERMRIDTTGNVGIGTNAPGYKLHNTGTSRLEGRITLGGNVNNFIEGSASNIDFKSNGNFNFIKGANTLLKILDSGNVGIGTTSPTEKLEVDGYVKASTGVKVGNYTTLIESGSETSISNSAYYPMFFKTNNAIRMTISNAGNVGIGTTSPSAKLSIANSTAGSSTLILRHSTGAIFDFQTGIANVTADALVIKDTTNSYDYLTLRGGNVGIGTTSPAEKLDVNGTVNLTNLKIATAQGTDGQVLTSTGSGIAWEDAGGGGGATDLNDLTDCFVDSSAAGGVSLVNVPSGGVGGRSTIIGKNAGNASTSSLIDATIIGNWAGYSQAGTFGATFIGSYAGYNQTSTSAFANIFIGEKAGYGAANSTSRNNVGIGKDTLLAITSGQKNITMGYRTMRFLTTGGSNIAIGVEAGEGITTQYNNVLIGQETLENSNSSSCVAIGHQAMDTSSNVGGYSIAVGYQAGRSFNTQQGLIAIGYQASYSHTSGADCVTIGRSAGKNNTTGQHRAIVGNFAAQYNTGSGNTVMGYNALKGPSSGAVTGAYNVAIGRNAADVLTSGNYNTVIGDDTAATLTTGGYNTYLGRNSGNGHINGSNCTLLGNDAVPSASSVSNEITLGNSSVAALRCQVTSITSLSDKRDKTKIEDSNYGLNVIDKLKPVTFDWNTRDGAKVGIKDLGFIAQDLQEVDDENLKLVYDTNPEKLEASYGRLIPVLVKAIQELKAEIEILKS